MQNDCEGVMKALTGANEPQFNPVVFALVMNKNSRTGTFY